MTTAQETTAGGRVPEWNLGDRIRKARIHGGFESQDALGAEIGGVSKSAIGGWETNRHAPEWSQLEDIAEVCHVDLIWLWGGDPRLKPPLRMIRGGSGEWYAPGDSNPEPSDYAPEEEEREAA